MAGCDETACACGGIGKTNGQLSAALFVSQWPCSVFSSHYVIRAIPPVWQNIHVEIQIAWVRECVPLYVFAWESLCVYVCWGWRISLGRCKNKGSSNVQNGTFFLEIDRYIGLPIFFPIFKHFTIIGLEFFFFCHVTYTIIQSITSSEMCSLYLTHPCAHTLGAVGTVHSAVDAQEML